MTAHDHDLCNAEIADLNSTIGSLRAQVAELAKALDRLLAGYDEERAVIAIDNSPGCIECTAGTTPDWWRDKQLCAYHAARAALAKVKP